MEGFVTSNTTDTFTAVFANFHHLPIKLRPLQKVGRLCINPDMTVSCISSREIELNKFGTLHWWYIVCKCYLCFDDKQFKEKLSSNNVVPISLPFCAGKHLGLLGLLSWLPTKCYQPCLPWQKCSPTATPQHFLCFMVGSLLLAMGPTQTSHYSGTSSTLPWHTEGTQTSTDHMNILKKLTPMIKEVSCANFLYCPF